MLIFSSDGDCVEPKKPIQGHVVPVACEVVKDLLNVGKWLGISLGGLVEANVGDTKSVSAAFLPSEGDRGAPRSVIFSNDPHLQLCFHLLLDEGQLGLAKTLQPWSIDRPRALSNLDLMLQKFGPPHVGQ